MRALPGVRDAVAMLRPDASGEAILVGYYTGARNCHAGGIEAGARKPTAGLHGSDGAEVVTESAPDAEWQNRSQGVAGAAYGHRKSKWKSSSSPERRQKSILAEIFCRGSRDGSQ